MNLPVPIDAIPAEFRERYAELLDVIDDFCNQHLDDEYRDACYLLAAACCQDGSPILSGRAKSWAAGLIWAIGRVNFLSDPSFEPCMKQQDFAGAIGVSVATISAKCSQIWDGLEMMQLDPRYSIKSRMKDNPLVWLVEVNGLLIDLRHAPREVQQAAYEQGVIPFIPEDESNE